MNRLFAIPALFAAVVLAACGGPAEISSPISGPGPVPYDERLVGTWYVIGGGDDEGVATLNVAPGGDGNLQVTGFYVVAAPRRDLAPGCAATADAHEHG